MCSQDHQHHFRRRFPRHRLHGRLRSHERRRRRIHPRSSQEPYPQRYPRQCRSVSPLLLYPQSLSSTLHSHPPSSYYHILTRTILRASPGPVHTPLQPASRPAEQMEGFGSGSQLGRPGQPSEIAPTYVFLASAEAELYCKTPSPPNAKYSA